MHTVLCLKRTNRLTAQEQEDVAAWLRQNVPSG